MSSQVTRSDTVIEEPRAERLSVKRLRLPKEQFVRGGATANNRLSQLFELKNKPPDTVTGVDQRVRDDVVEVLPHVNVESSAGTYGESIGMNWKMDY